MAGDDQPHVPAAPLHIVLVGPEIAANTGSIGRTCVALGACLWLVRPLGFHLDEHRRRRAGLDYWDQLSLRVVDGFDEIESAHSPARLWLYSTRGTRSHVDCAVRPGDVLVFGSESRGLPAGLRDSYRDRLLRLPMAQGVRSLNLACAVSIAAYEAARQTGLLASLNP